MEMNSICTSSSITARCSMGRCGEPCSMEQYHIALAEKENVRRYFSIHRVDFTTSSADQPQQLIFTF